MKCLSLRQPWLWAILHGKRIENRKWNTHYRGPILLHAAKGCTGKEYVEAIDWMVAAGVADEFPGIDAMQRGGIVGRARIVDVYPPMPPGGVDQEDSMCAAFSKAYGIDHRWRMSDQYGFVLADVEPLPFHPMKGSLGLFNVDETLIPGSVYVTALPLPWEDLRRAVNGLPPRMGTAGCRDTNAEDNCEEFDAAGYDGTGKCSSDGHYMCVECSHLSPNATRFAETRDGRGDRLRLFWGRPRSVATRAA